MTFRFLVLLAVFLGCGAFGGVTAIMPPAAFIQNALCPTLYVANNENVLGFPARASGNIAPIVKIAVPTTFGITGVARYRDKLYVSSITGIRIYQLTAGTPHLIGTIGGPKTHFGQPGPLVFDKSGTLYVMDSAPVNEPSSDGIFVFRPGSTGNVAPQAFLPDPAGDGRYGPPSFLYDVTIDSFGKLYAVAFAPNGFSDIFVYPPGPNSATKPVDIYLGHDTIFPQGIAVDASQYIYLTGSLGPSIKSHFDPGLLLYAPGNSGNPVKTITFNRDAQIGDLIIDTNNYVYFAYLLPTGQESIDVLSPRAAQGGLKLVRRISGKATGLTESSLNNASEISF